MSDTPPKSINPWTLWVPIIMIVLGVVILYNYLITQSLEREKNRPPYMARLERDLDGLTERSGKQVKLSDIQGKVMVMAHVYTSCPMGCSEIVGEMKDIYDAYAAKHPGLQFVSFAIDPEDGPERLTKYAEANDIMKDNWWFVNGDQTKIRTYLTHVVKFNRVEEKTKEQQTSAVDKYAHDMRIALIDHQGHLRGMYDLMVADPEFRASNKRRLLKDLAYLLSEQEKAPKS